MPILKEQTLVQSYGLIDSLRREGRSDDAATVEALLAAAQAEQPAYLTTAEVAARLGISRHSVVRLIRRGHLASVAIAGRSMVTPQALERYVRIRRVLDELDADRPPLSPEEAARIGHMGRKDWPWRDDPV